MVYPSNALAKSSTAYATVSLPLEPQQNDKGFFRKSSQSSSENCNPRFAATALISSFDALIKSFLPGFMVSSLNVPRFHYLHDSAQGQQQASDLKSKIVVHD